MNIPFSPPDITDLEIQAVVDTLKSGWITTGSKTKLFENKIAEYCGTSKVVCLNSATAALELVLRLLGIGPGDEVITSAYTYTASASVIHHVGAKIVLVDVAPDSYQMDYQKLADAITEKTKAIIPVDIGGVMCDYNKLYAALENKKHLYRPSNNEYQRLFGRPIVLADAAHSFGATYHGKKSGQVGDFTCFSFHAVKSLTTAEGGAVTWRERRELNHEALYHQLMLYSLHGQSKDALSKIKTGSWEYDIEFLGWKCNMTDIMASIGLAQLIRYKSMMERRMELATLYTRLLNPLGFDVLCHNGECLQGNGHLFMTRLPGANEATRNEIITHMAQNAIACNVHFKPLPLLTAYKRLGFHIVDFPNAFRQYENEISLPLHSLLADENAAYVINILKESLTTTRRG